MRTKNIATRLVQIVLGMAFAATGMAGTTDLAIEPLVTSTSTSVLPNLFVMMDDSGSMNWDFMPDTGSSGSPAIFGNDKVGIASAQCNYVYYDPNITYKPPVDAKGVSYPKAEFGSAWRDGFDQTQGQVNLANAFGLQWYQENKDPNVAAGSAAFYYVYFGTQTQAVQKKFYDTNSTFHQECNVSRDKPTATITVSGSGGGTLSSIKVGATELMSGAYTASSGTSAKNIAQGIAQKIQVKDSKGNALYSATASDNKIIITGPADAMGETVVFTGPSGWALSKASFPPFKRITVSATSGPGGKDELTNFANWFSYYRTRMNMMKSGVGLAFKPIDAHYRVGFATMNNTGDKMLVNIETFDDAQKADFYKTLYRSSPGGGTPLLTALSSAGRLYGKKLTKLNNVDVKDPVQYSCQKNFTLLSTDGFWNTGSTAGLDGKAVGNVDVGTPRPYVDGGNATITETTPIETKTIKTTPRTETVKTQRTDKKTWTATRTRTDTYTRKDVQSAAGNCGAGKKSVKTTTYSKTGDVKVTETTTYTWSQPVETTRVTDYQDKETTTSTTTRTVVTTNGVVASDTLSEPSVSGPVKSTEQIGVVQANEALGAEGVTSDVAYSWNAASADYGTSTSKTTCELTSTQTGTTYAKVTTGTVYTPLVTNPPGPKLQGPETEVPDSSKSDSGTPSIETVGPTAGTTTSVVTNSTGGVADTLSDVAMYYYKTDLRTTGNCAGSLTGVDVCENNVMGSGADVATWQHMTTFTLGLGAPGKMTFSPSYLTDTSGDFHSIKNGVRADPAKGICSWGVTGEPCNWPTPGSFKTPNYDRNGKITSYSDNGKPENIDDLWHAAVNGRGTYFSATNPTSLEVGLSNALASVNGMAAAAASVAISNPNPVPNDNYVFSSSFNTGSWDGELKRRAMDAATGAVSAVADWKAQEQLDNNTSRNIYTYSATSTNHLKTFDWDNLDETQRGYFSKDSISTLSQFCTGAPSCLSDATKAAAAGSSLVEFIRGNRSNEGPITDITKYYRQRTHVLGDIVGSAAVYVKKPVRKYADKGYGTFAEQKKDRQGVVYVGGNDGMLHAFNADTGAELWAYVPSFVLPNLYKLADKNYSSKHQYYVDGSPVVGDVLIGDEWHTILVGGLNGGGRGYYAMDITDPASPSVLWEFTAPDMGYSYGNPVITKLPGSGTWVVLLTSGYNNGSSGDGKGHLYVLNAKTGVAEMPALVTTAGSSETPSGLARLAVWADTPATDNTALRAYGGDLLGNVWRFDLAKKEVTLLATLQDGDRKAQPVTAKPELGKVGPHVMVFVGTGRYLGMTDLGDKQRQSFYGIKDDLSTTGVGNPRENKFVQQTLTNATCPDVPPGGMCIPGQAIRTGSNNTVNLAVNNGWYIDLPDTGERDNTNPVLVSGVIAFATNVPASDACSAGGYGYINFVDFKNGTAVIGSVKQPGGITSDPEPNVSNGAVNVAVGVADGSVPNQIIVPPGSASTRRVTWRELTTER